MDTEIFALDAENIDKALINKAGSIIKNGGLVITKENLLVKIWGYESDAEYNNVEVYISFLRKKLAYIKADVTIKTLRGIGYSLECSE